MRVWHHTASNTNNAFKVKHTVMQTYGLLVQSQRHRYIQSTKINTSRFPSFSYILTTTKINAESTSQSEHLSQEMRMKLWHHTPSSTNSTFKAKHTPIQTYALFAQSQPHRSAIRSTKINAESTLQSEHLSQQMRMRMRLRHGTALDKNNAFKVKHTATQTYVLFAQSQSHRSAIQSTKVNAS